MYRKWINLSLQVSFSFYNLNEISGLSDRAKFANQP